MDSIIFIELNKNLLEDLISAIQSIFSFVLYKINEVNEEGKEPKLEELIKDIEITDTASNVGPNIARLVTEAIRLSVARTLTYLHMYGLHDFKQSLTYFTPRVRAPSLFYFFQGRDRLSRL